MIGLFKTNQVVANILLLLYILIVRFPAFVDLPEPVSSVSGGILWQMSFGGATISPNGLFYFAIFIIAIHGFLINVIENRFKLSGELNLLPGVCYILLTSFIPNSFFLSPLSIAICFLILAIYEILNSYKLYLPATQIFNTGLFLSIGFLFYTSFWLFIPFAIIALSIIRNFKLREQLMFVFGFLSPLVIVGTFCYWNGSYANFINAQLWTAFAWKDWAFDSNWLHWIPLGIIILLILVMLLNFRTFQLKKGIQERKGIDILYWSMVFSGIAVFFQPELHLDHLMLLLPCLGYGLSFILLRLRIARAEALHFTIFLAVILWQFNPWAA